MPLGRGVRYRVTKENVRLAFRGHTVIEAKNLKTGAIHTPKEFAAERRQTNLPHPAKNLGAHLKAPHSGEIVTDHHRTRRG